MAASLAPSHRSSEVLVTASGELDLRTVGSVSEVLAAACAQAQSLVVVDLTSVEFMDCAALRPVLAARELMRSRGGELVVRGASRRCRRLLVLTGLTELLDECEDGASPGVC